MSKLSEVKAHLRSGRVYRRADLEQWSNAVDRHVQQLLQDGTLTKLSGGLYYHPKQTTFGAVPADDESLVHAFLKDKRFLLTSPNAYNALGVGTTQLHNKTTVYNHKRHGEFKLGGRAFDFRLKPHFPSKLTPEFLLVDLVNNLKELPEDHDKVLSQVKHKTEAVDQRRLARAVAQYGGIRAKKFFSKVLAGDRLRHAAA